MEMKRINADITVSPQISASDIAAIKDAGFKSIVCNRPDGESGDQPNFEEIEAAAKAAGLDMRYQPIISGKITDQDALDFGANFGDLPKPIFAYCRKSRDAHVSLAKCFEFIS